MGVQLTILLVILCGSCFDLIVVHGENSATCFQGWSWISGTCYKLYTDSLPWKEAQNACAKLGGHLVKFDDILQQTDVQDTIMTDPKKNVWIGLKANDTDWTWTDGQSNQYNSFQGPGTVDAALGQCVTMDSRFWYKTHCNETNSYVCQLPTFDCNFQDGWISSPSHHCLHFNLNLATSWDEARKECRKTHSDLVIPQPEDKSSIRNASKDQELWIGMYNESSISAFVWVNDSISSGNIPGFQHQGTKQCMATLHTTISTSTIWVQKACEEHKGFICEKALLVENGQYVTLEYPAYELQSSPHGNITRHTPAMSVENKQQTMSSTTVDKYFNQQTKTVHSMTTEDALTTFYSDTSQSLTTEDTITTLYSNISHSLPTRRGSMADINKPQRYLMTAGQVDILVEKLLEVVNCSFGVLQHSVDKLIDIALVYISGRQIFQVFMRVIDVLLDHRKPINLRLCRVKDITDLVDEFLHRVIRNTRFVVRVKNQLNNVGYIMDVVKKGTHQSFHLKGLTVNNIYWSDVSKDVIFLSMIVLRINESHDQLLQTQTLGQMTTKTKMISPLLSLTAFTGNKTVSIHHDFMIDTKVDETQIKEDSNASGFSWCTFYKPKERVWSKNGCTTLLRTGQSTSCRCNHTTNFAVLMQVKDIKLDTPHVLALDIITYIGCSVSLISQLITLTVFTCIGSIDSERIFVHRNLCIAIICSQLCFLGGARAIQHKIICSIVALVLHYFYTAVFVWMLVEGMLLYSKIVQVFGTEKSRIVYFCTFGWGVPVLVVIISAAANWEGYGTTNSCWLSIKTGAIWAFVGPALSIILVNLIILWMVIKIVISSAKTESRTHNSQVRSGVKGALILTPLLGLTWVFGLMAVNEDLVVFQYLFAVCNSFQGFFIFLFHCVLNTEVRQALKRLHERQQLEGMELSSSTSSSRNGTPKKVLITKNVMQRNQSNGMMSTRIGSSQFMQRKQSNGTTSTRIGSSQSLDSRSSAMSDDVVVQEVSCDEIES